MKPSILLSAAFAMQAVIIGPAVADQGLVPLFQRAKELDPQYLLAQSSRDAAQEGLAYAESAFGPKVTFAASAFRTDRLEQSRTFTGSTVENINTINAQNAQIQARQAIYRQRDWAAKDQAVAQFESAQHLFLFAGQDLAARFAEAWVVVVAARDMVVMYQSALTAAVDIRNEMDRRYRAGEASVQDRDQARAKLEQAKAQLDDAKARLEIAEIGLRDIAGPEAKVPLGHSLKGLQPLTTAQYSEPTLIAEIEQKNLEVLAARFQEDAARYEREKAKADRTPTLDAFATMSKGQNDQIFTIKDENRVGVQLSVPIYTSGALSSLIAQADANYRKAQAQSRVTLLKARSEGLSAFASLAPLYARVMAADQSVDAALSMQKAQQLGLKAGVNSRADLAQASQELVAAQRQQIESRRDYVTTWVKLQRAVSLLSEQQLELLQANLTRAR